MIRPATAADIPRMVELGRAMHAESPVFSRMRFDPEKLAATIAHMIDSPGGFAYVAVHGGQVVGGLVAMAAPHYFSPDLVACDLAFFMAADHRGGLSMVRMVGEYVRWAQGMGAVLIQLGLMTGVNVGQTEALLTRLGWHRAGLVMEF